MRSKELLEKIQNALLDKETAKPHPHSYSSVPALRTLPSMPAQPAPIKKALRKTDIVTKEWSSEVKNTSNVSATLVTEPLPGAHLIPDRVHRWNFKNYASLARKWHKPARHKSEEIAGKVSVIASSEQQNHQEEKKQDELWRDLMKNNEERHFRIDRITNFFS